MRAPPPSSHRASHAFSQVNTLPPPSSFCVCISVQTDLPTVILVCRLSISTRTLFSTTATRATRIYVRLMSNTMDVPGKAQKPYSHDLKSHHYSHILSEVFPQGTMETKEQRQGNLMTFQKTSGSPFLHLLPYIYGILKGAIRKSYTFKFMMEVVHICDEAIVR